jgi:hypothetical protein
VGMSKEEKQAHYAKFHAERAAQLGRPVQQRTPREPHPEEVDLLCPGCEQLAQVVGDSPRWTCPACAKTWEIIECPRCFAAFQLERAAVAHANCPWCDGRTKISDKKSERSTAWILNHEMDERGMPVGSYSRDRRVLTGCTVIGGHGHEIQPGARVTVTFDAEQMAVAVAGGKTTTIPYSSIVGFDIEGRGVVQSGTQLMGGGFGLAGAAAGMLAASAINSLTSKTNIETVINIRATDLAVILFYDQVDPSNLKLQLSPAIARIDAAERARAGGREAANDPVAQLAQLDELHNAGALTAEEFEQAKSRIIEGM